MIYTVLTYLFLPVLYFFFLIRNRNKKSIKKFLIIQIAKIGDFICSTPIFREIKKKYPEVHLTVMVNPITKELAEVNPYIDEIIPITMGKYKGFFGKIKLANIIRKGKYDVGICLNPNVPFAVTLYWGLVPIRLSVMPNFLGITFKMASKFFTYLEPHLSRQLVIETYMKMLKAAGIENYSLTKEVYKSKNADAKVKQILGYTNKALIGIAISSGNKLKELGLEKIVNLINALLENFNDIYIVLIGSVQERIFAEKIQSYTKKERIINTVGLLNLKELPALIEKLRLFIGVDTGITYMADALNIPLINIAGPANMEDQRPTGQKVKIIQRKNLPCVPCSHAFKSPYYCKMNTRQCIESISVEEIIDATRRLLFETLV